jgi:hypothetical protein
MQLLLMLLIYNYLIATLVWLVWVVRFFTKDLSRGKT